MFLLFHVLLTIIHQKHILPAIYDSPAPNPNMITSVAAVKKVKLFEDKGRVLHFLNSSDRVINYPVKNIHILCSVTRPQHNIPKP